MALQKQSSYSAGSSDMMAMAIGFAIILHAAGIFGISFSGEDDEKPEAENIEVILVQQTSEEAPKEADFLAQANLEGGGESEEAKRPAAPFVAPFPEESPEIVTPTSAQSEPQVEQEPAEESEGSVQEDVPVEEVQEEEIEEETEELAVKAEELIVVETEKAEEKIPEPENKPKPADSVETEDPEPTKADEPKPETPTAIDLMAAATKQASLQAEIDRALEAQARRPSQKWISASTREYKYASYMEAWRAKVERIGNINYPDQARVDQLSGSLILDVALNPDGTINEINIKKSSGHQVLDDAAIHIVRLASPFAVFPNNIRKDVDILHITRTWKFLNNSTFSGK